MFSFKIIGNPPYYPEIKKIYSGSDSDVITYMCLDTPFIEPFSYSIGYFDYKNILPGTIFNIISGYKTGNLDIICDEQSSELLEKYGIVSYRDMSFLNDKIFTNDVISQEAILHYLLLNRRYEAIKDYGTVIFTNPRILVAMTEKLYPFMTEYKKRGHMEKYILVTSSGDGEVTEKDIPILEDENLILWYTYNIRFDHPKLRIIPLGIANSKIKFGSPITFKKTKPGIKTKECYFGFSLWTNRETRESVRKELSSFLEWIEPNKNYEDYLKELSEYKYCICPDGKGIDTHRFWECQRTGTVPIVKESIWSGYWKRKYPDMPMIILKDWSEFPTITYDKTWTFDANILNIQMYIKEILAEIGLVHATSELVHATSELVHATCSNDLNNHVYKKLKKDSDRLITLGTDILVKGESYMGYKTQVIKDFLNSRKDEEVILFTDAFDVRLMADYSSILASFKKLNTKILFSAERNCYPDEKMAKFYTNKNVYKYLNSGCFIGYMKELKEIVKKDINIQENDQLYYTKVYLKYQNRPEFIKLDHNCVIFQNLYLAWNDLEPTSLRNNITNTYPMIFHGNGGNAKGDMFFNQMVLNKLR